MTAAMGSYRYAASAAARGDNIVAMISLETIGYYSDAVGSQRYPFPFGLVLPSRGDFLAMVSNIRSVRVLRAAAKAFRSATRLPLIASPAPASIPGVAWSDHWSFWQHGYRALMLTDTVKARPHLILFGDEAHTRVGAGSALGAPSDAANILKSVLARGEVRMIGATTLSAYKEHLQEDEATRPLPRVRSPPQSSHCRGSG